MFRVPIPLVGSFQRGRIIRSDDPLEAVWRHVERVGTIDNLSQVVASKGLPAENARIASLRIRQAVELRRASRGTTALTRPLLLYYSCLNLVRGVLLAYAGDIGGPSHGLQYKPGPDLLSCAARVPNRGTFRKIALDLGTKEEELKDRSFSLRDLLALVPELCGDFNLLQSGPSSIAHVRINAFINADTTLRYHIDRVSEEHFGEKWSEWFPWFTDLCEYAGDHTLRLKQRPKDDAAVSDMCSQLLHDLRWREDPLWYDQVQWPGVFLMSRIPSYLAALFILSNVSRYEPEYLEQCTSELTNTGYVLTSFLEHAERYFPQLMLKILARSPVYFA